MSNPKPDLHNDNAHIKFGENPLRFTQVIVLCCRLITLSKIEEIYQLAILNQISTTSMHIPSLVKIHWYLLKLSSGNENKDMLWAPNSFKNLGNLPISNPKPDLHNINAHTKFDKNSSILTKVTIQK